MTEQYPEPPIQTDPLPAPQPASSSQDSGSMIAITAIIALAIVTSCCILSCAVVVLAFITNVSW